MNRAGALANAGHAIGTILLRISMLMLGANQCEFCHTSVLGPAT
jgi:hypothetical protein